MKTYVTFKRTWWKFNPNWSGGLEPCIGDKLNIKHWATREEAYNYCQQMNSDSYNFPDPNPLSIKYEFDKELNVIVVDSGTLINKLRSGE